MHTKHRINLNQISSAQALLYGDSYDAAIRVLVEEIARRPKIIKQNGISAPLADIANLVEAEKLDATAVADEVGNDVFSDNGFCRKC